MTRVGHVCGPIRVTGRSYSCHAHDQKVTTVVPLCDQLVHQRVGQGKTLAVQWRSDFLAVTVRADRTGSALNWRHCWRRWDPRATRGPCHEQAARRSASALRGGLTSHSSLTGDEMGKCLFCQQKHVLAEKPFPSLTSCVPNVSMC